MKSLDFRAFWEFFEPKNTILSRFLLTIPLHNDKISHVDLMADRTAGGGLKGKSEVFGFSTTEDVLCQYRSGKGRIAEWNLISESSELR